MPSRSTAFKLAAAVLIAVAMACPTIALGQVRVGTTAVPAHVSTAKVVESNPPEGHSPEVALRWSLLPGAGQIYNHQAWKIPIIYGAFAVAGYFIYDNYSSMVKFRDEYLTRINDGVATLEGYESYPNSNIYSLYQSYNRYFQLSIIATVGIYALNLVDAYVFGHLFDFQIDDELTLTVMPQAIPTTTGLLPGFGARLLF